MWHHNNANYIKESNFVGNKCNFINSVNLTDSQKSSDTISCEDESPEIIYSELSQEKYKNPGM